LQLTSIFLYKERYFIISLKGMNLEKLFGSKTKVDILKYLLFRRQGISMRALESELERTFPAIKKQVDSLEESGILTVNKEGS
jgi:predicted transcriptional regulator